MNLFKNLAYFQSYSVFVHNFQLYGKNYLQMSGHDPQKMNFQKRRWTI